VRQSRLHHLGVVVASALALAVPGSPTRGGELPSGWIHAGDRPAEYESGVDPRGGRAGNACAFIRGRGANPGGFGTIMQTISAEDYRGKRVRFSAEVKVAAVAGWAGLWMRVDGAWRSRQLPPMLAFDNMQNRPIAGDRSWTRYDVVLDVPAEASGISFGLLLSGAGQAWMEGLRLETVGKDVATTDRLVLPKRPNLSFER
jgi:hypothetical protein